MDTNILPTRPKKMSVGENPEAVFTANVMEETISLVVKCDRTVAKVGGG